MLLFGSQCQASMRFELFIAARYLRAKRRQAVVGVITAISVAGVAAGVAALIIALAITTGMRRDLQDRLLGSTSHVELMRTAGDGIREWRPLVARLAKLPHVTADAPGLYGQVLVSRGARSGGLMIKGVLPDEERRVTDLLDMVKLGSAQALEPAPPVDPGRYCAAAADRDWPGPGDDARRQCWRYGAGDQPAGRADAAGHRAQVPALLRCRHLPLRLLPVRLQHGVCAAADAQRLLGEPDLISVIAFKVDDLYHADAIGREIEQAAGAGFLTTNWMEQNRELFRALRLEQIVTFIVIGLIVCVAALNILIALTMMVMEKTRDIAVLMSFGVRQEQVRRIFLMQGLLISAVGTALGLVLGYAASWAGGHYRFIHLPGDVYSIDYLPFAPRISDGADRGGGGAGGLAGGYALSFAVAARVLPAEALRYE